MNRSVSDAIVFFGATGDLAYEQIFPALQGLVRDEGLDVPTIGVAKPGWSLDQWRIVDPVLDNVVLPVTYEQGSWGPEEANGLIRPDGPWHNPKPAALRP